MLARADHRLLAALFFAIVALSGPAWAQETAERAVEGETNDPKAKTEDNTEGDLRAEVERQNREIEILKEKVSDLELNSEMGGEADFDLAAPGQEAGGRLLEIYGFFDLTMFYLHADKGSLLDSMLPNKLSFAVSRVNMYFMSRLSETFSALIELRLTFMPMGEETSYQDDFFGSEYYRIDTTSADPVTQEEIPLGGLSIERVQLTWKPNDYFGITAGRFLTPFGIWNIDHGSPVIISIGQPYFMLRKAMPLAQTGVILFGRLFPFKYSYLDYALTVSNGRGPTEAVYDLDNNKALGGRLRFNYDDGKDFSLRLGGYVYWGENTDVTKRISGLDPFALETKETEKYSELTGSIDLLIEIFGLRLQSECIRGKITHKKHAMRTIPILGIDDPAGSYIPDFIKWGVYGLLAYEFDLQSDEGLMFLTPYFMAEFYTPEDTYDEYYQVIYRGGLNFKPNSFLTIKAEVNQSQFPRSELIDKFWGFLAQGAVAF